MVLAISQPKMVRLPRNEKQTQRLNSRPQMWPPGFILTVIFKLGHDLDLEFSRSDMKFAISQPKVVRLPRNEKQTCRLNIRAQMWPMGLTLAMTLISEFSRSNVILTNWRPRSGLNIYQIVTGMTSVVGVVDSSSIIPLHIMIDSAKRFFVQLETDFLYSKLKVACP